MRNLESGVAGSLFASSFLQESPAAGNLCACRAGAGGRRPITAPGCAHLCHWGRGCVSQKEMHDAVRIFLGIYLSLKMETGFRSLLGEAAVP